MTNENRELRKNKVDEANKAIEVLPNLQTSKFEGNIDIIKITGKTRIDTPEGATEYFTNRFSQFTEDQKT